MLANEGFEENLSLVLSVVIGVTVILRVSDEVKVTKNGHHGVGQLVNF